MIGALLLYASLWPEPDLSAFRGTPQIVTAREMTAVAPARERSVVEKLTTRVVEPVDIAITVDSTRAAEFVRLYVAHSVQPDTSRLRLPVVGEIALLGWAGRLDEQLELYSVSTDRTVRRHVFDADCGPLEWLYDGAELLVQQGRWCWARDALGVAGVGAIGYGLGAQQWEFVAGGALSLALRKLIF